MDESVKGYIDREGFKADTDFAIAEMKRGADFISKVNEDIKNMRGATGLKTMVDAANSSEKAIKGLQVTTANYQKVLEVVAGELGNLSAAQLSQLKVINEQYIAEEKLRAGARETIKLVKDEINMDAKKQAGKSAIAKSNAELNAELKREKVERDRLAKVQTAENNSLEKAQALIDYYTARKKKLNLETESGRAINERYNKAIEKQNAFIKANADVETARVKNIGNYQGSAKIIVDALEKEIQKLKQLEAQRVRVANAGSSPIGFRQGGNQAATVTGSAGGDFKGFTLSANQSTEALQQLDKQITQSRVVVEGFRKVVDQPQFLKMAGSFGDANKELRFFTKALIDMERQGQGNSEAAVQLRGHLAQLTDEIADAKAEVKALSSDTRGFDLFAGSVTFAADAMQTAAGAAILFGASEEEVEEQTRTLVAIQSVANGVKGIANELTTRGTAANKLLAASQALYAQATDATAKATVRLAAASKLLFGAGLILAIGLLVANFDKIKRAITGVTKEQDLLNETTKDYAQGAQGAIESVSKVRNAFDQAKSGLISKKEALKIYNDTLGDSLGHTNSLAVAEQNLIDKGEAFIQITALKAQANALFAKSAELSAKGLTAPLEDQTSTYDKFITGFNVFLGRNTNAVNKAIQAQKDGVLTAQQEAEKGAAILTAEGEKVLKKAEELQKQFNITDPEIGKDRQAARAKAAEDAKKALEERLKAQLELQKRTAAAERALLIENLNERIRINQAIIDDETASITRQLDASGKITAAKKALALSEYQTAIAAEVVIENGKRVVIEKSNAEKKLAYTKYTNEITKITEESAKTDKNIRTKYFEEINDAWTKAEMDAMEDFERQAQEKRDALEIEYNNQIAALAESYNKKKISLEQFNKEQAKIEAKYKLDQLKAELKHQEELIKISLLTPEAKKAAEKELARLRKELRQAEKLDVEGENEELIKQLGKVQEVANLVFTTVSGLFDAALTKRLNGYQKEKDAIDKKAAAEIEAINASLSSEEEKAARIIIVNARAQTQKEAIERREREEKLKTARLEKAITIANIVLANALNIVKSIGSPFKLALAIATGAAQLAVAIATPLPRFFKGKAKGQPVGAGDGLGLVNDHPDGRTTEIVEHADGSFTAPQGRNVVMPIKQSDIVHPDADAWMMAMLGAAHRDIGRAISLPLNSNDRKLEAALEKTATKIVAAINNKKEFHLGSSDRGMVALHKWGANQIKYVEQNTNW